MLEELCERWLDNCFDHFDWVALPSDQILNDRSLKKWGADAIRDVNQKFRLTSEIHSGIIGGTENLWIEVTRFVELTYTRWPWLNGNLGEQSGALKTTGRYEWVRYTAKVSDVCRAPIPACISAPCSSYTPVFFPGTDKKTLPFNSQNSLLW